MVSIEDAIKAINPSAVFSCTPADNYDGITWQEGTIPIDKATVEAKKIELQAVYDAKQYQRDRTQRPQHGGYPEIGDQLDMIYHDQVNGTTTFKDAIKVIKDANPKGDN